MTEAPQVRLRVERLLQGVVERPREEWSRRVTELCAQQPALADALRRRFNVSFEQVCHRLTTLNRPGERGVAFFMIRVDQAGNISKRFGGGVLAFARSGGGCARWRLFDAFRAPERIHVQGLELPDGSRFVSVARAVARPRRVAAAVPPAATAARATGGRK